MTAHAYLKNEFTEDKKCQNLMLAQLLYIPLWDNTVFRINLIHSTTAVVHTEIADAYFAKRRNFLISVLTLLIDFHANIKEQNKHQQCFHVLKV